MPWFRPLTARLSNWRQSTAPVAPLPCPIEYSFSDLPPSLRLSPCGISSAPSDFAATPKFICPFCGVDISPGPSFPFSFQIYDFRPQKSARRSHPPAFGTGLYCYSNIRDLRGEHMPHRNRQHATIRRQGRLRQTHYMIRTTGFRTRPFRYSDTTEFGVEDSSPPKVEFARHRPDLTPSGVTIGIRACDKLF